MHIYLSPEAAVTVASFHFAHSIFVRQLPGNGFKNHGNRPKMPDCRPLFLAIATQNRVFAPVLQSHRFKNRSYDGS